MIRTHRVENNSLIYTDTEHDLKQGKDRGESILQKNPN